jgi:hypothetical protein
MTLFWCLSRSDSQNVACSRRELLGNFAAIGAALSLPVSKLESTYPEPEFKIGDLVAEDWFDEFDKSATDFGEIRGLSYIPDNSSGYPANTWVYYVYWTRTTCGCDSSYPCYIDTEPVTGDRLRLVNYR